MILAPSSVISYSHFRLIFIRLRHTHAIQQWKIETDGSFLCTWLIPIVIVFFLWYNGRNSNVRVYYRIRFILLYSLHTASYSCRLNVRLAVVKVVQYLSDLLYRECSRSNRFLFRLSFHRQSIPGYPDKELSLPLLIRLHLQL